jgi:DNA-binding protein H-NS
MFYHNAVRYESYELAARAAAIAARNGQAQSIVRASDQKTWTGLFRKYDEAPAQQAQPAAPTPDIAALEARIAALEAALAELLSAQAAKPRRARKVA